MFRAEISYTNGAKSFKLCSDSKDELIAVVSNLVFSNPGVYEIISIYNPRTKLIGIVAQDGKYRSKDLS